MRTLQNPDVDARLTEREQDIIKAVRAGYTERNELAQQLGISPHTVRNHLNSIYGKLGIKNITKLSRWASNEDV